MGFREWVAKQIGQSLPAPKNEAPPPTPVTPSASYPVYLSNGGGYTDTHQYVSPDTSKTISTAYRCANIISDDIASLPFQQFTTLGRGSLRVLPDPATRNIPYLMEIAPNRWMVPLIFKKAVIDWLIFWGNSYIWQPMSSYRELFLLPADRTFPVFDKAGNLWYSTSFPNGTSDLLPAVEVTHLMINSKNGLIGQSVLAYAMETFGRQMGSHKTQDQIMGNGLNPSVIIWAQSELKPDARQKVKDEFIDSIRDTEKSGGVAVFDPKITKFETVTMKPADAQFLQSMDLTDVEIANFFGVPMYKLNSGKQSYESNMQHDIDYLKTTLNPYLLQFEQAARVKWLRTEEQVTNYFRFNRDALLQTDAKTRAEYMEIAIRSGRMSPNEARAIDDQAPYDGGDDYFVQSNWVRVQDLGAQNNNTGGQL